jgi:hypothetical protein
VIDQRYPSYLNGSEAGSCVVVGLFSGEYVLGTIHCCLLVSPDDVCATDIRLVRYLAQFTCRTKQEVNRYLAFHALPNSFLLSLLSSKLQVRL